MQNTQPDPAGGWDVSDMRYSDDTNVDICDSINPVFDVYRVTDTFPNLCELASTALWRVAYQHHKGVYLDSRGRLKNSSTSTG